MSIPHVFLTRFNLPSEGVESLIRAREGWLRERIELFEHYTVPSVRAQRGGGVHWIVYLDTESPQWLLDKMYAWRDEGLLTPLLRTSVSPAERASDLRQLLGEVGPVITSNLDNDDGLAVDFVERLRKAPAKGEHTALYLTHGLIARGDRVYLRSDRSNAFCAVRDENLSDPWTCWYDWHNRLGIHMPVVHVGGNPAWLQVIHGANVSNRVRGSLARPGAYRELFGGLIDDAGIPSTGEIARDRLVEAPTRFVRDQARGGLRAGLVKVLGKDRFDTLKYRGGRVARGGAGQVREAVAKVRGK